jgi:Cap4 dsDNA endonuclease
LDSATTRSSGPPLSAATSRIQTQQSFRTALLQPFTLTPAHRGGRTARKGYTFQDWWISYALLGSFSEPNTLTYARIEAVEDLDLIVQRDKSWIEQYVQVKSKEEGKRNWTINSLEEQEILSRFFRLFKAFRESPHDSSRSIELLLVVEGDLTDQVRQLEQGSQEEKELLFSILTSIELIEASIAYKSSAQSIRRFLQNSASRLLTGGILSEEIAWDDLSRKVERTSLILPKDFKRALTSAVASTAALIDEFLEALAFQSRVPGIELLEEASIKRLMGIADIGIKEAKEALLRLVQNVALESSKTSPTLIDKSTFLSWLGIRPRPSLKNKPEIVPDYIERTEFYEMFTKLVSDEQFVLLYGLSKMGKSQFASHYIDRSGNAAYLWFAFSGEPDDADRLMKQVATFVGNATAIWQLADEMEGSKMDRSHFFERVANIDTPEILVVLDDAHKADPTLLGLLNTYICKWNNSKLLLLSEEKMPKAEAIGAKQIAFPGFNPAEAFKFIQLQGVDPDPAWLEIAGMTIQFGGHPLMLKAICQSLPPRPTPQDVKSLSATLPSVTSAKAFLDHLSNELFFRLLRTPDQRALLSRLAVLPGRFDWNVARSVADVTPKLSITLSDWRYMKSVVLDELDLDHCSIPQLLKVIAKENLPSNIPQRHILIAAAHQQLKPGGSKKVSFLDFHAAILSLIFAEEYRQAALFFTMATPKLIEFASFQDLSVLFMIFTGDPFLEKLEDNYLQWRLLSAELMFRSRDPKACRGEKVYKLLARMRLLAQKQQRRWFFRAAVANMIILIRAKRLASISSPSTRFLRKGFAPVQFTLRLILKNGIGEEDAAQQTEIHLNSYKFFAWISRVSGLDLLKDVLLALHRIKKYYLPDNVLAEIYATFAVNVKEVERARTMLSEHAAAYLTAKYDAGYFASEYALAHLIHTHDGDYAMARSVLQNLSQSAHRSPVLMYRISAAIGDAWFAEKKFEESATFYSDALKGHHVRGMRQHIQERLIDSLARSGGTGRAFGVALSILRKRHRRLSFEAKARLYARLAYTAAQSKKMTQAAVACLGLRRLAEKEDSDQFHWLCLYLANWIIGQIAPPEDLLTPQSAADFRDISALSETVPDQFLNEWRENDKSKVKSYIQISSILELERHYKRALHLLQKATIEARAAAFVSDPAFYWMLNVKMGRLYFLINRGAAAAKLFREAIGFKVADKKFSDEIAGWLSCSLLDSAVSHVTDTTFQTFSETLHKECAEWPQAQAAILMWHARGLFDRLLIQKAKMLIGEAEDAARNSKAYFILKMAIEERLFRRIPQFYLTFNRSAWLIDVIAATIELGQEHIPSETRSNFAKTFRALCSANQQVMGSGEAIFGQHQTIWEKYPFEVSSLALWKMGHASNVPIYILAPLEAFFARKAPFLQTDV